MFEPGSPLLSIAASLLLAIASQSCLMASEVAVLDNGMRLRAASVERSGSRLILHSQDGGAIELDAARLASLETEPDAPRPAPVSAPEPPAPAVESAPLSVRDLITAAALRHGLPPEFVHGVAQAESGYQPSARSPKGAIGVMQLMPATAAKFAADPADVRQNIDAGTRLLRDLLLKYEGTQNGVRRALAAYNAGEAAVDRYGGVPPYRETQGYVERVVGLYWKNVRAGLSASVSGAN